MGEGRMAYEFLQTMGNYLEDDDLRPKTITKQQILDFLDDIIKEFELSYDIGQEDKSKIKGIIDNYFDGVTNDKDRLIAEMGAEAAAEIAAAAAEITATALSWLPGVNFALDATAIALNATAIGLEIDVQNLESTVVEEISDASSRILNNSPLGQKAIGKYAKVADKNTKFMNMLRIAIPISLMRALCFSVVLVTKKKKKGKITANDLKEQFIWYYDTGKTNPDLIKKFEDLYNYIKKHPNDIKNYEEKVKIVLNGLSPHTQVKALGAILGINATMIMINGKRLYKAYQSVKSIAKAFKIGFGELNEAGEVGSEVVEGAEEGTMKMLQGFSIVTSFIAAAANFVFGVLEIMAAVDANKKLTAGITKAQTSINDYYSHLIDAARKRTEKK